MQELEKILEEIKEALEENKVIELNGDGTVNRYIIDVASAWGSIKAIIHNHINDGWIPVEERMPEEYGEYLVTIVPSAGYLWAKRIIANFSDLMGIVKKPIFYTGEVGKLISKILPIWLSPGVLFRSRISRNSRKPASIPAVPVVGR